MTTARPLCPHCQNALIAKKDALVCVQHGVLLRLKEFERVTSKKFSQWLWSVWFAVRQSGGVRCPDCLSRMIILNPGDTKNLELDCCPTCFAIWLDKGEIADLHLAFSAYEATEAAAEPEAVRMQDLIAKELLKRDERLSRYQRITAFSEALMRRVPWWRRLMIH